MTNQQKIEWYISKGFAVRVGVNKIFFESGNSFYGLNENDVAVSFHIFDPVICNSEVTPIPPKPYEFKVGERVKILTGDDKGNIRTVQRSDGIGIYVDNNPYDDYTLYYCFNLAPALPEDEECEVVEVERCNVAGNINGVPYWNFTKPDGKKLKIKVIKN